MDYRGGDHETAGWDCVCSCLAVRLARVCGLAYTACTSALACDEQRYGSCSCRYWRYISVMPLRFTFYNMTVTVHRLAALMRQ